MTDPWQGHQPEDQPGDQPNDWQASDAPPTYAAPPTNPGALNPRYTRSGWPKVFGIISIVFGSFTVLSMTCGLAMLPFMSHFAQFVQAQQGQNPMTGGLPLWWYISSSVVSLALGILQLTAGIRLVGRSLLGVTLHTLWAKIFLVVAVIQYPISFWMQWQGGGLSSGGTIGMAFGIFTWIITVCIALGYPIVLLYWLSKPAVRSEYEAW